MRKVRVWDDVLNEMLYGRVEQFDDMLGFRFEKHLETENPIYMWSTGLKDKNGREIYEGDVVSGMYFDSLSKSEKPTICFVKWDESGYWTFRGEKYFLGGYLTDIRDCEVIGNIYENPELLDTEGFK